MHKLEPEEVKDILLCGAERHRKWVQDKINEYVGLGFVFYQASLSEDDFYKLVYNSETISSCSLKDAADVFLKNKCENFNIEKLRKSMSEGGYDSTSFLFLRQLYLEEDSNGSYYIDNGLHRALALASLLREGIDYSRIPAIIAFKKPPT